MGGVAIHIQLFTLCNVHVHVHNPRDQRELLTSFPVYFQTAKKDLLNLDFEGILNYFRVSLPKRFQTEQQCQHLFHALRGFKVRMMCSLCRLSINFVHV